MSVKRKQHPENQLDPFYIYLEPAPAVNVPLPVKIYSDQKRYASINMLILDQNNVIHIIISLSIL